MCVSSSSASTTGFEELVELELGEVMLKRERKAGGVEVRAHVVVVTREEGESEGREVLLLLLLLLAVVGGAGVVEGGRARGAGERESAGDGGYL